MSSSKIKVEEINLEDLIILGEDCHIPISMEFPKPDGGIVRAKALVKQLTLKEMKKINLKETDETELATEVVGVGLLKKDGSCFDREEILALPIGVVRTISDKILELSGVNMNEEIRNF